MQFEKIRLDIADGVALLTFDDPKVFNAMGEPMLAEITDALDLIDERREDVRCLVMTGAGKAFCAGANLRDRGLGKSKPAGAVLESHYHPILRRWRRLHCPIVIAVNGPAAGGGMSIAMMGDIVLAARSAYFLQAFRRIGLVPDVGATWLLPRRIGVARSMELSLLGERLPAETALKWGLVNRVCDDAALTDEAMTLAREIAQGPARAMGAIRALYWDSTKHTFEQQLDLEYRTQRAALATEDHREGVAAFFEKRTATFRGR